MKIATKLVVFFASVVVLFVLLAAVMLQQLRAVTDGYQELLSGQVSQIEMARVIQVDFKKQVQEWKDILLRGYSPEDLGKYTRQFHSQETQVQQGAKSLVQTVQDSSARELLLQFLAAHETMGQKYEAAYNSYVSGNFDFKAADKMVRGQDREATDLFDKVVLRLNDSVESSIAAQKTAVRRSLTFVLVFFGAMLAVLGLLGSLTVRSILQRLAKLQAVADRLAAADVEGLTIDISGSDEIGCFGESMKGVHAAIEELSRMASYAQK